MSDDNRIGIETVIFWLCVIGAVVIYFISAFQPEQPLRHELNDAAGVLVVVAVLLIIFT